MANKQRSQIIDQLANDIADDVGNMHSDDLDLISSEFNKTLSDALMKFNSSTFDDAGFIKRMRDLDIDGSQDKSVIKNALSGIGSEYIAAESLHQTELLLRRDIKNICTQLPEMRDVIYVVRDAIIECNVATGEVSRSLLFENTDKMEIYESQVKELERTHKLLMATKNFIVPRALESGEMYIQVTPYRKLFAELEMIKDKKNPSSAISLEDDISVFRESIPNTISESFEESKSLFSEGNLKLIMESASSITKIDANVDHKIENPSTNMSTSNSNNDNLIKSEITSLLESIDIHNGSSVMLSEMGDEGFREFLFREYRESVKNESSKDSSPETHFMESMEESMTEANNIFKGIDQDYIDTKKYNDIKGCYIKYLDPLRLTPIRMDRRVIGYYYVTSTMDLQRNSGQASNGVIDISYQHYTRDKNLVDKLANLIIQSFDKKMLEKNIKLKNEIVDIIMAHRFSEGKLSFIYIPEDEVTRIVINEDENGKGHSILEPSIFPARMTLMLTMYNMLYVLNNNTTRIHYLKSSGLNKDYAAQIQRTIRKFQSRRITVDDIYSYSGVLNKVGGMGEMVLPAGRNDYKAIETDTIEASQNPVNVEFLEQQRRQALSGTGVPHLLVINAIDEVDFAKTLEMANTRFLSTVSAYKIDFNDGLTELYKKIMSECTDIPKEDIKNFKYKLNAIKQQELVITAEMIQNFNSMVEVVTAVYYSKRDMEDENGNPTPKQMHLRRELAKKYLPQLDFDELDEIVKQVNLKANDDILQQKVNDITIDNSDIEEVSNGSK